MDRASGLRTEPRDGYAIAKPQGKPSLHLRRKTPETPGFLQFARCPGSCGFSFRSSRCLNCSSNLIGHSDPNKPANGGWDRIKSRTGAALGWGRQKQKKE
ncbi:MAG: hypothetical protein ABW213_03980 [Tardiphaga sp.]